MQNPASGNNIEQGKGGVRTNLQRRQSYFDKIGEYLKNAAKATTQNDFLDNYDAIGGVNLSDFFSTNPEKPVGVNAKDTKRHNISKEKFESGEQILKLVH